MFDKILVANRGEIACRIIRSCKKLNVKSVAIYSSVDYESAHVDLADEAVQLDGIVPKDNYLNIPKIVEVAKQTGAQAVHPGYGFLSENTDFAQACEKENIVFIGPTVDQLKSFGLKHIARELAIKAKVPLSPGTDLLSSVDEALQEAEKIKYPIMLKSTAGGGGIGLQLCQNPDDLKKKYTMVERLAKANFSNSGLYIEKYVQKARHIEVQIFGDGNGNIVVLGERDCSVQRRNQKVVEETPAQNLSEDIRKQLHACAKRLGEEKKFTSAGTVEFVYDSIANEFYFLEVNTRLQVEHGITEEVYGVDIVSWMILNAAREFDYEKYKHYEHQKPQGHAIELRIYAEDPAKNFQPSSGLLTNVVFPDNIRVDTWVQQGTPVSSYYDPLLAKLISHCDTREEAIKTLQQSLETMEMYGVQTNQQFLKLILASEGFISAQYTTKFADELPYKPYTIDVLGSGGMSTVQDYPGRLGYWDVGVPPSGPFDPLSFRLGNQILGNPLDCAGIEITLIGPTFKFNQPVKVCFTGAPMHATLDNKPVPFYEAIEVKQGQVLNIGRLKQAGLRTYLLLEGGINVPKYLNSRSTFTLGQFGGHCGRVLKTGDVLPLNEKFDKTKSKGPGNLMKELVPEITDEWTLKVLYGPHGAPEFFLEEDIDTLKSYQFKVHYNSDRTGVRLVGPRPKWARKSGGESGLHPSNIHDNAYAMGALNFTGDMPILLGPDGPSCGGFVCPFVVIQAELWKMGQLKAGDTVRFEVVNFLEAHTLYQKQEHEIANLQPLQNGVLKSPKTDGKGKIDLTAMDNQILYQKEAEGERIKVVVRAQGDRYILVEYGPLILDLNFRFRVHTLMTSIQESKTEGILDLTPGIRSIQIHYNQGILHVEDLVALIIELDLNLLPIDKIEVPSRIVHMPLSWEDESTIQAIQKYMQSVRKDAPWCPSNIEFIRRANGLESVQKVYDIMFNATYLVLGLGDVYLGAPVATPINPLHRLVTTKYNPARTWTPQNAVGIGGVYMCIYGMEGPGGYQLTGRTLQIYNTYRITPEFKLGFPWLLRFFDQVKFYPVSKDEYTKMRKDFLIGRTSLKIEETTFKLKDYNQFVKDNQKEFSAFKQYTQDSFQKELESWGDANVAYDEAEDSGQEKIVDLPDKCAFVDAPIAGNLWKIVVKEGEEVKEGQTVAIIESMKTEIQVNSQLGGVIHSVLSQEAATIDMGQHLFIVKSDSIQ